MNRKILLVSDNSALVTRLTKLNDNWQLTTTPILPPDFFIESVRSNDDYIRYKE